MNSERPIYIALGANLPFNGHAPQDTLKLALQSLGQKDIEIVAISAFWSSPSWPEPSKPRYVNAVAEIRTELDPSQLLDRLQAVEEAFGRTREVRWDSRTLDLDIIDFQGEVLNTKRLTLPHPRVADRPFVLLPLAEIAPCWSHPSSGVLLTDLLEALDAADKDATRRLV